MAEGKRTDRGWALACTIAGASGTAVFVLVGLMSHWWTSWLWAAVLVIYTAVQWTRYRRAKALS